jgi:hypothetical protein
MPVEVDNTLPRQEFNTSSGQAESRLNGAMSEVKNDSDSGIGTPEERDGKL